MRTTKTELLVSWINGNLSHVCQTLKHTDKLTAMDFAVEIALFRGAKEAGRLLSLMQKEYV